VSACGAPDGPTPTRATGEDSTFSKPRQAESTLALGPCADLDESIEELCQIADGGNDILAEAAGITAGSWYASPATHLGYELWLIVLAGRDSRDLSGRLPRAHPILIRHGFVD
jgi:hypothetical protein